MSKGLALKRAWPLFRESLQQCRNAPFADPDDEGKLTVTVAGQTLPSNFSNDNQQLILQSALCSFDLLESRLARVCELLGSK